MFGLALVQGEWKVYVSGLLDREQQDCYLLNITASDGLYVARTAVEVTITDANDNSPICNQVRQYEEPLHLNFSSPHAKHIILICDSLKKLNVGIKARFHPETMCNVWVI